MASSRERKPPSPEALALLYMRSERGWTQGELAALYCFAFLYMAARGLPPACNQAWQLPRVGCPAKGSSPPGVKMRTR